MRRLYQLLWLPFYRWWALRHIRRERIFRYGDLRISAPPGVFHPGIYFSTPIFLKFLERIDFQGKRTLDIGTGTGVLALFATQQGAIVTALDINPQAVETAKKNAGFNTTPIHQHTHTPTQLQFLRSDLFDAVPPAIFDIILINPPYYPRRPENAGEYAFFAGENLEYFDKLFLQLPAFIHAGTKTWMILSEDCDYEKIAGAAKANAFNLDRVFEQKKWGERLFVVDCSWNAFYTETQRYGEINT